AYGQPTALRRRQSERAAPPLGELVEALCKKVSGLKRLRLSSLEPGDLNDDLLRVLASHEQVVPHFHLPLQTGSDAILRRMNRQYTRDAFLDMLDRVERAFDRPALTTDIIVGFPGEDDREFQRTLEVVDRARFIHIHAFPYSPRPGTAAARWTDRFIHGPVVNDRIEELNRRSLAHSLAFRSQFMGDPVNVIAESSRPGQVGDLRQGRCERYFMVWFEAPLVRPGDCVRVRIEQVTPTRTVGKLLPADQEVPA
ncbi:MAG TPA: radical SAM protein, partial [Tepidisphaeraceae bacterium]|nr:radical SAM protein [Tepidisphaeraceae bacterium]